MSTIVSAVIAIITRSPADPRIKARLAPVVPGHDVRRELALAFLDDLVARVVALPNVALKVAVTPPVEGLRMSRPSIVWNQLMAQRGASLGDRLQYVLDDLASAGFVHLVLLGADVPDLPASCLEEALRIIRDNPKAVVTGPSGDGSFYLLGLTARAGSVPQLLADVRWGTPQMLDDVEASAAAQGLTVHRVQAWHDVDTPEDLTALRQRLATAPASAPCTANLLRQFGVVAPTAEPPRRP